ncbi:MAG: PEP-CTERM sorting domain-containing protein [Pyrinomonadaceae bacterium]
MFAASTKADSIRVLYSEINLGGGLFQYDYTFFNDLNPATFTDSNLYDVSFTLNSSATGAAVLLPSSWEQIQATGLLNVFAVNVGAPPEGNEIAPSTSLAGFRFLFDYRAGNLPFTASVTNPADLDQPLVFNGVSAPASIPEPATLILLGTGLGGIVLKVRKRLGEKNLVEE